MVGPYEMEHEYGLVGGNIFHGELSLEQLFHMRPAPGYADFRTPITGLYNGGSATHGGGGVCGIPGWQAAKAGDRRPAAPPSGALGRATRPGGIAPPRGVTAPAARRPATAVRAGGPSRDARSPHGWPWSGPAPGRAASATVWSPR